MGYTTETLRTIRRRVLSTEARVSELAETEANSIKEAEEYHDTREELVEVEVECYTYALRGVLSGNLSDDKYAIELALGQHDTDGGLA